MGDRLVVITFLGERHVVWQNETSFVLVVHREAFVSLALLPHSYIW
jgi:hypothetical protein